MNASSWETARRVLAIRLDSLGDVLMTTPALRALKETSPGRQVTLLTSPAGAAVARMSPDVDEVLVYEAPWMKATPARTGVALDMALLRLLRERAFDAAAIFTVFSQNPLPAAHLCYLAEIPLRLAYCRENPYLLLTDWAPESEPQAQVRHEVQRQLDLVATVGCTTTNPRLALTPPTDEVLRIRRWMDEQQLSSQPWLLIHPGASAPSRRYPAEHFATVARALVREHGMSVVFTGSEAEVPLVESIREAMGAPSLSLAGGLTLGGLVALVAEAPLLLTNNTGPAHLAAATGTPVVDLYALTNPQHTPWQVPQRVLYHDVPCKFCFKSICPLEHHACLALVEPLAVVRAVLELRAETARPISTDCLPTLALAGGV